MTPEEIDALAEAIVEKLKYPIIGLVCGLVLGAFLIAVFG